MKYTITLLLGYAIGLYVHRYWFMPDEIDKRASEYFIMRYDGIKDKMVLKDSTYYFDEYALHYLKFGITKK